VLSRRQLLLGTAAAAVVGTGALAAPRLRDELTGPSQPPHPVPSGEEGELVATSFWSAARGARSDLRIGYPGRAARGLPVLLTLHERGGSADGVFGRHGYGALLSQAVRQGVPPFAVAAVDGGDHAYWHPRRSGEDPQRMLLDEVLPMLARRGLRTERIALGGWSMGGYGALLLAERLGPRRVAAVLADSPAVWERWEDSSPDAFDGRADFEAHDVLAGATRLRGIPVRVTCGTSDPFLPGVRALLRAVPWAQRDVAAGGHDLAWWQHVGPAQLAFAGRALTPLR
jgi:enterochelin esterase-like enzyme